MVNNNFQFCYYSNKACDECSNAMDIPLPSKMSDSKRNEIACKTCLWMCIPLTILLDFISCPFRCCNHYCNCKLQEEKNNKMTNKEIITTQIKK